MDDLEPTDCQIRRKKLLEHIFNVETVTSATAAAYLGIKVKVAAVTLLRLHRFGWLNREKVVLKGGGREYVYTPARGMFERWRDYPFGRGHREENESLLE